MTEKANDTWSYDDLMTHYCWMTDEECAAEGVEPGSVRFYTAEGLLNEKPDNAKLIPGGPIKRRDTRALLERDNIEEVLP